MKVFDRIKRFLQNKTTTEIKSFEDELAHKYGLKRYLYATSEGLPIMGNFNNNEELSAKAPELFKALSELEQSNIYTISGETTNYLLIRVIPKVILLAETSKRLTLTEINDLIKRTKEELGL